MEFIGIDFGNHPYVSEVLVEIGPDNVFIIKEIITWDKEITLDPSEYKLIPAE